MTRAEVINLAKAHTATFALPVCAGCTPGYFKQQCETWLRLFLVSLPCVTAWREFGGAVAATTDALLGFEVRLDGGEYFPLVEVVPHPMGGRTLQVVEEPTPVPVDRDRIGELLEGQARLESQLEALRTMVMARDVGVQQRLMRLLILVNHWGAAGWVGRLRLPFIGSLTLTLEREPVAVATKAERPRTDADDPPTLRDTGHDDPPTLR